MQNSHFGSKIKISKNMSRSILQFAVSDLNLKTNERHTIGMKGYTNNSNSICEEEGKGFFFQVRVFVKLVKYKICFFSTTEANKVPCSQKLHKRIPTQKKELQQYRNKLKLLLFLSIAIISILLFIRTILGTG